MFKEARFSRQRTDLEAQMPQHYGAKVNPWVQAKGCLFMDLFAYWGGLRLLLRDDVFIIPLGRARDFFLVGGPACREAAAITGATVAL